MNLKYLIIIIDRRNDNDHVESNLQSNIDHSQTLIKYHLYYKSKINKVHITSMINFEKLTGTLFIYGRAIF